MYMEIRTQMPGLKQDGKITHDWLKNNIEKFDYFPFQCTPSLWIPKTQATSFTMLVDNFGIQYPLNQHVHPLIK